MISRLRQRPRGDGGLTLVELLVVIVLVGVIGMVVTAGMIATQQTSRNVGIRSQDLANLEVALDSMSKKLATMATRPTTGTPDSAIVSATPTSITFYAYNIPGKAPSLISFTVDSQHRLIESVAKTTQCTSTRPSDWVYGTPSTRVLATHLNASTNVFTYHLAPVASPAPTSFAGQPIAATGTPAAIPTASFQSIDSIEINLSVDLPSTPDIPSATATTQVFLPNQLIPTTNIPGAAC